jgi:hypothetical protein
MHDRRRAALIEIKSTKDRSFSQTRTSGLSCWMSVPPPSASGQPRPHSLTRQSRRSRLRPRDGIGRYVQSHSGCYRWRTTGQLPDYIFRKLTNWDNERGQNKEKPDNSAIMQPIAHDLSEAQIKAVAAYVSQLN